MKKSKPLIIILTTAVFSFLFGFSAYHLPLLLNRGAAISSNSSVDSQLLTLKNGASLRLLPQTGEQGKINQPFTLALILNGNHNIINAADAVLSFDPQGLKLLKINSEEGASSLFTLARKQVKEGKIYLTAIKKRPDQTPIKEVLLGTLTFKPLRKGESKITFEFFPGKTFGSTVIRAGDSANILDEVKGTKMIIEP